MSMSALAKPAISANAILTAPLGLGAVGAAVFTQGIGAAILTAPVSLAAVGAALAGIGQGLGLFATVDYSYLFDATRGGGASGNILLASGRARTNTSATLDDFLTSMLYWPSIRTVMVADDAIEAVREFLLAANPTAIGLLFSALASPSMEERRWVLIELLGEMGTSVDVDVRFRHLQVSLASTNAGDRSAAASALGSIWHPLALSILEKQLARENNSIVKAVIEANMRVVEQNGSAAKTVA